MGAGAENHDDDHAMLDTVSIVRVDVARAHVEVVSGPELPADIAAALLTRVTEAFAAEGTRGASAPLDGTRLALPSAGGTYEAVSARGISGPAAPAFLCAPTSAAARPASRLEELTAARFFARAPLAAWVTNGRGETLLLGRDAPPAPREPGFPHLDRVALADVYEPAAASRYQALNEAVIRDGRVLVTTEDGPAVGPDGPSAYHVARFPVFPAPGARGESGAEVEAGGVAIEITDRVRLERDLARSEARLRAMLEATNDGVWVVGADFRTTWTNAAVKSILGYTDEELAALSPLDLAHPDDRDHVREQQAARRDGESMTGEVRMVAKGGRTVWMLHSSAPIQDADGAFLGAIAIFKDVTLRKEEEARTKRSDARMQESQRLEVLARLAGGIAHDFNNLLTAVLTGADTLSGELHPDHVSARETVEAIRQAGQRAAVLCRQLLALSGRGRFSMAPVDVLTTVTDAVRALRPSLDARHVVDIAGASDVSKAERAPPVLADDAQIQQLVTNLILNASEAIGARPGIIRVRVERADVDRETIAETHLAPEMPAGTYLRLSVADDGPGIAAAVRDRLFEPFVTTRTTGRGLGLPAVLGIVRGHGGAVRVRSEPNAGTTFEVFIPVADAQIARRSRAPASSPAGQGQLVLVVDDEKLVRKAVCRTLRARGFQTLEAEDGVVGVELFRANVDRVSVVLLDLSMPRIDGVETLAGIRALRPGVPAVIMSGYSEDEAAARLVGVGLASFVAKPFTPDELVRTIRSALVLPPR